MMRSPASSGRQVLATDRRAALRRRPMLQRVGRWDLGAGELRRRTFRRGIRGRPELRGGAHHREGRGDTYHRHDRHREKDSSPPRRRSIERAKMLVRVTTPRSSRGTLAWAEMRDVVVLSEHPSARRPVTD